MDKDPRSIISKYASGRVFLTAVHELPAKPAQVEQVLALARDLVLEAEVGGVAGSGLSCNLLHCTHARYPTRLNTALSCRPGCA